VIRIMIAIEQAASADLAGTKRGAAGVSNV